MYLHSFAKALSMCSSLGRLIFQDDVLKKRKKKCASHFMITSPAVGHRARLTCLNTSSPHSSFLCLAKTETFCFKCRTLTSQIVLRLCTFFFFFSDTVSYISLQNKHLLVNSCEFSFSFFQFWLYVYFYVLTLRYFSFI